MSSVNKGKLYKDLQSAYTKAYSHKLSKKDLQDNVNIIWNSNKKSSNIGDLIGEEIIKLDRLAFERRNKFDNFWIKASQSKVSGVPNKDNLNASSSINSDPQTSKEQLTENVTISSTESSSAVELLSDEGKENTTIESSSEKVHEIVKKDFQKPMQDKLRNEIVVLVSEISTYKKRERCDLMTDDMAKEFKLKTKRLEECQILLKRKETEMNRLRNFRSDRKRRLEKVLEEEPDLKKKLGVRNSVGQPSLEEDQPNLLTAIIELAFSGCAAHERRRDEVIRTVKTLDDLTEKLREINYCLSRSATYLRLLPKRANTTEGKRHVKSVPVKLIRASNDIHKQHADSTFAMTTISHLEELASILGPNEVIFLSQDDKARVPIGLTAAKLQAPLMMHMEYRYLLLL